jgi:hypothetical protein
MEIKPKRYAKMCCAVVDHGAILVSSFIEAEDPSIAAKRFSGPRREVMV